MTTIVSLTLLLAAAGNVAQAGISSWKWLGYTFNGTDGYHRTTVYAYEFNSTAVIDVTVLNNYVSGKPLNISALKVGMDWGKNYTSSMTSLATPYVIPWGESRVISISFMVPGPTEVSNKFQYSYAVYLEYVNSTTGPKQIIGSDKLVGGTNFVVYSADQVAALKTKQIVDEIFSSTSANNFNSTKAKILWVNADNATFVAGLLYGQGDFAGAKTQYGNALSLINQAFAAEQTKGGSIDDAEVQVLQAQAESLKASANYLNGLSNMWLLIGIAAILFAVGYLIRGLGSLRKTSAVVAA